MFASLSMTTSLMVVEPESMPICTGPQSAPKGRQGTVAFKWRAWKSSYSCLFANSGGRLT